MMQPAARSSSVASGDWPNSPGKERDAESGLDYFGARYYDPSSGRFLSEDPLQLNAGMNFYEYSYNNPPNFNDPSGLQPAPAWVPPPPQLTVITGGGGRVAHTTRFSLCGAVRVAAVAY